MKTTLSPSNPGNSSLPGLRSTERQPQPEDRASTWAFYFMMGGLVLGLLYFIALAFTL